MTAGVIFDWRGTLVTTLTPRQWVAEALRRLGRDHGPDAVEPVLSAVADASGPEDRLDGPGVDSDADVHRSTYLGVFADAGLDDELAETLYAVESDPRHNPFALDAAATLHALQGGGVRVAVVSDIHFDVRPAFAAAGLGGLVDVFTLSFEHGVQKPAPEIFRIALASLGVAAPDALMVGDRAGPDGAAVEEGIATLLLPPLVDVADRRLHKVLALCGAGT